jgi:dihydrofolate reductase
VSVVVTNFVSLDGVIQSVLAPDEDTEGGFTQGGWVSDHMDDEVAMYMAAVTTGSRAMLLGRRTYEGFARVWPHASTADPAVAAMNRMPKYVASRTLTTGTWNNTHILGRDLEQEVGHLRAETAEDEIAVFGSANLLRTLIQHQLVDRYQLLTFPLVLGRGKRMFDARTETIALTLTSSHTTTSGVVISTYTPTPRQSSGRCLS